MTDAKNISLLSAPPPADSRAHPYEFASNLDEFFQYQAKFQRKYTAREQALMFLQGMRQVTAFASASVQLIHDLEQYPTTGPFPTRIHLANIPITLASHPAAATPMPNSVSGQYAPARLTVTRATPSAQPTEQVTERTQPRYTPTPRRGGNQMRQPKDTQCPACFTYEHEVGECRVLPKVAACLAYIKEHASMVQTTIQRYKERQHPSNRQSVKEMLINAVYGQLGKPESDEFDGLIDHLTDSLCSQTHQEPDYDTNIFHLHACTASNKHQDFADIHSEMQPVKFPLLEEIHHAVEASQTHDWITDEHNDPQPLSCITLSVTTTQQRDLADTGASVSATGTRELLHNFTSETRYEIAGYDGKVTKAAGEGYAHVQNEATHLIDRILFVYSPGITGTIFSLEHHAQTHPKVHRWTQEAIPSTQGGWITFYDADQNVVSRYPTVRSKGVYFIQNMKFIPSASTPGPDIETPTTPNVPSSSATIAHISQVYADLPNDFVSADNFDGFATYIKVPTTTQPLCIPDARQSVQLFKMESSPLDRRSYNLKSGTNIWHIVPNRSYGKRRNASMVFPHSHVFLRSSDAERATLPN